MSSTSAPNRRSFLARGAAIAAVPAVATLAGGALAEPASADPLPDYAPIPPSALGPAVNAQGYFVGRVEKNLYWVTDGTYQAAFLTTRDGVVLFDAPPSIGHNLQRAIDEVASANGVSNKVTHIVYSHHHADHLGASSLFGRDVVRIGHAETKVLLEGLGPEYADFEIEDLNPKRFVQKQLLDDLNADPGAQQQPARQAAANGRPLTPASVRRPTRTRPEPTGSHSSR